jgi:hypothetical protein
MMGVFMAIRIGNHSSVNSCDSRINENYEQRIYTSDASAITSLSSTRTREKTCYLFISFFKKKAYNLVCKFQELVGTFRASLFYKLNNNVFDLLEVRRVRTRAKGLLLADKIRNRASADTIVATFSELPFFEQEYIKKIIWEKKGSNPQMISNFGGNWMRDNPQDPDILNAVFDWMRSAAAIKPFLESFKKKVFDLCSSKENVKLAFQELPSVLQNRIKEALHIGIVKQGICSSEMSDPNSLNEGFAIFEKDPKGLEVKVSLLCIQYQLLKLL